MSSITKDLSQSLRQFSHPKEISTSPSGSSLQTHSASSPQNTPNLPKENSVENL